MNEKDTDIHCNVIRCRKPLGLESQACVTSCSHIFCLDCANRSFTQALVCPACETSLTQSDDIVLTQLNPSEEYKSSVLAGLRPDVVMDICSRSISFYYYQMSQELCFRSMVQQKLENRCNSLQDQMREALRETNRALKAEKQKNLALSREQEQDKRRLHDLQAQLQEKSRQFQKLQTMYEKLKRKTVTPSMQQTFQSTTTVAAAAANHPGAAEPVLQPSYIPSTSRSSFVTPFVPPARMRDTPKPNPYNAPQDYNHVMPSPIMRPSMSTTARSVAEGRYYHHHGPRYATVVSPTAQSVATSRSRTPMPSPHRRPSFIAPATPRR